MALRDVFQLPTLLAPLAPLEAFGSWRQLSRSWSRSLWAENIRREVWDSLGLCDWWNALVWKGCVWIHKFFYLIYYIYYLVHFSTDDTQK